MFKKFIYISFFISLLIGQVNQINDILKKQGINKKISESEIKSILKDNNLTFPTKLEEGAKIREQSAKDDIKLELDKIDKINRAVNEDTNSESYQPNNYQNKTAKEKSLDLNLDINEAKNNNHLTNLDESSIAKLKNYGYDIFFSDPSIFQKTSSEASDPNHIIAPGDEIIIMIWGQTEINEKYYVTKDGYLFIENVGQIFVNGITLSELEKKLLKHLKKVYSSLGDKDNATSFLDISLGETSLRPKRIFALGEVTQPGAYNTAPSTTLFTSLFYFNGPSLNGSLRDIELIRNGKSIGKIDYYSYLLSGKKVNDINLQRDDIVFIPPRGKTITVKGEIKRPAIYELKKNENFNDIIKIAGGFVPTTYSKFCQIDRITPISQRDNSGFGRKKIDIDISKNLNDLKNIKLYDGDIITFFKIEDSYSNVVSIVGEIIRPGEYELKNGMRVLDLIEKADGLKGTSYLENVLVTRKNSNNILSQFMINLKKAKLNDKEHNIILKNYDVIKIYNYDEMRYKSDLFISGHVINPGKKKFKEGMTVRDLLFIGGGFENDEHLAATFLDRADYITLNPDMSTTIKFFRVDSVLENKGLAQKKLKMGDQIKIYSKLSIHGFEPEFVNVTGYVKKPGEYRLHKNTHLSDILLQAGGIEDSTHIKNMFLNRAHIFRISKTKTSRELITININELLKDNKKYSLHNGDIIKIYSKDALGIFETINIEGFVQKPGEYDYKENSSLYDIILEAGGFSQNDAHYVIEIARLDNSSKSEKTKLLVYEFDNQAQDILKTKIISGSSSVLDDIIIKPKDRIYIRTYTANEQNTVSILGAVAYPGNFVITNNSNKISDIIERAGGLTNDAYPFASEFNRDGKKVKLSFENILNNNRSKDNFEVLAGDSIVIKRNVNLIEVLGEVNSPGIYQFQKGKNISDYIKFAGGLTKNAQLYSSYVKYPNGKSKKIKLLNKTTKVPDGSKIYIVPKDSTEPFSITDYVTNLTSIYSDLLQAYLILTLATSNN